MRLKWMLVFGLALMSVQVCAQEAPLLKSEKERSSYAIGVQTGRNLKKDNAEVDLDPLFKGGRDGIAGIKLLMPERELRKVLQSFQNEMRRKMVLNQRLQSVDNRKKGSDFLAANKAKAGVVTLTSGVQYRILKAGDGKKPTDSDTVLCNYRVTLLDETEFDSTEPGKPSPLKVAQLFPGWKEALKLMPVGSRWQIFVPSQLAYGERGVGHDIGPNETLILEVELIAIN
jgi:FKBP-type peptidyl-prolyl cis-trans isomerase